MRTDPARWIVVALAASLVATTTGCPCEDCCACHCHGASCTVYAEVHERCMDCESTCKDLCASEHCPYVSGEACSGEDPLSCLDADDDGLPGSCNCADHGCEGIEFDCDDSTPLCTTDCTTDANQDGHRDCDAACEDLDEDGIPDCEDGCIDVDHDSHGAGYQCAGPDCDDADADAWSSCDSCADADLDGSYGGCDAYAEHPGPDCDDSSPLCVQDCTSDLNSNGVRDCDESCQDLDRDGYGVGADCLGEDCDDSANDCITDCTTDGNGNGVRDCDEQCVDQDRDGYGAGVDCLGEDCDDQAETCQNDCQDLDGDGTADCRDACVDLDQDGYGQGPDCPGADCSDDDPDNWTSCLTCVDADLDGAWSGCDRFVEHLGPDCDDASMTCAADCTLDENGNGARDCDEDCVDLDRDGYGQGPDCAGTDCADSDTDNWVSCLACVDVDLDGAWSGCDRFVEHVGPDCDDASPTCAADCTADDNGNGVRDCDEDCRDLDRDGRGDGADCLGPDCNDDLADCWTAGEGCCLLTCHDEDQDGYGQGYTCQGRDCHDGDADCASVGSACCQTGTATCNALLTACTPACSGFALDCLQTCFESGTPTAQSLYDDLQGCMILNDCMPSDVTCISQRCSAEAGACMSDQ